VRRTEAKQFFAAGCKRENPRRQRWELTRACLALLYCADGETNLKIRSPVLLANTPAAHLAPSTPSEAARLSGKVMCEPPNAHLHVFHGRIAIYKPSPAHDGSGSDDEATDGAGDPVPAGSTTAGA
jgi:hypothetical protein